MSYCKGLIPVESTQTQRIGAKYVSIIFWSKKMQFNVKEYLKLKILKIS